MKTKKRSPVYDSTVFVIEIRLHLLIHDTVSSVQLTFNLGSSMSTSHSFSEILLLTEFLCGEGPRLKFWQNTQVLQNIIPVTD